LAWQLGEVQYERFSSTSWRRSQRTSTTRIRGLAPWQPQQATRELLALVQSVLVEYAEYLLITIRQTFNRLIGAHGYPKAFERVKNGELLVVVSPFITKFAIESDDITRLCRLAVMNGGRVHMVVDEQSANDQAKGAPEAIASLKDARRDYPLPGWHPQQDTRSSRSRNC
jgi:hypothetical protein